MSPGIYKRQCAKMKLKAYIMKVTPCFLGHTRRTQQGKGIILM